MTDSFVSSFSEVLPILTRKLQDIANPRSDELLNKLTMQQFKCLGELDVKQYSVLCSDLEEIFRDYEKCLEDEMNLKKRKCLIFKKINQLNEKINEHAEIGKERTEQLEQCKFDFLSSTNDEPISNLEKPSQKFTDQPCPEEPVYSTRTTKTKESSVRRTQIDREISAPEYSSNYHLQQSSSKRSENCRDNSYSKLDQSILEGVTDITLHDSTIARRLHFDIDDDDDDKEEVFKKPIVRSEKSRDVTKDSIRPCGVRNSYDEMPPPPVFTSSYGKQFNKN